MSKRGEIWLANLNPRRGTEPGKTRPVLIVQAQSLLDAVHPSTLVIPLTTNDDVFFWRCRNVVWNRQSGMDVDVLGDWDRRFSYLFRDGGDDQCVLRFGS